MPSHDFSVPSGLTNYSVCLARRTVISHVYPLTVYNACYHLPLPAVPSTVITIHISDFSQLLTSLPLHTGHKANIYSAQFHVAPRPSFLPLSLSRLSLHPHRHSGPIHNANTIGQWPGSVGLLTPCPSCLSLQFSWSSSLRHCTCSKTAVRT